jgi:arginase
MQRLSGVRVISVPYDSGRRGVRMGRGPEHLLSNGLADALRANGREVRATVVESASDFPAEVATAFELAGRVSGRVRETADVGEVALVLSGNCGVCVGTLAGLGAAGDVGVVWFDAHADFNTPETTSSGFLDGMGTAVAVGHCWTEIATGVPGFVPLPEANLLFVGTRDVDGAERRRLDESEATVVGARSIREGGVQRALRPALDALSGRVERVYVHLDLDVLDPEEIGPANGYAVAGGMSREEVEEALVLIGERFSVVAAGIASYDPSLDREGKVSRAALALAGALLGSG